MSDIYLVWHSRGVDVEDSKIDAFRCYWAMKDSDLRWPHAVEGPGGVDLTEEAERYSDEADERQLQRYREEPKLLGRIELREKDSEGWARVEDIYEGNCLARNSEGVWGRHGEPYGEFKDRMMAQFTEALGPDRVRFTPVN